METGSFDGDARHFNSAAMHSMRPWRCQNVFMILLRDPDWPPTGAGHPHVLKTIPVFPRRLTTTEGRSLQIVNTFSEELIDELEWL
jgi:hypothetical protein